MRWEGMPGHKRTTLSEGRTLGRARRWASTERLLLYKLLGIHGLGGYGCDYSVLCCKLMPVTKQRTCCNIAAAWYSSS